MPPKVYVELLGALYFFLENFFLCGLWNMRFITERQIGKYKMFMNAVYWIVRLFRDNKNTKCNICFCSFINFVFWN